MNIRTFVKIVFAFGVVGFISTIYWTVEGLHKIISWLF
jgi:hypothetical protein